MRDASQARSLIAANAMPGEALSAFYEPPIATSMSLAGLAVPRAREPKTSA